jgi:hypothetical protein
MSYNPESRENDPVLLFNVMQQYANSCPEDVQMQRELVAVFYNQLNGKGRSRVSVEKAEPWRLDEVSRRIWRKAHFYVAQLAGDEYELIRSRAGGKPLPIGHPLEERVEDELIHFDIPGCRD